MVAAGDVLEVVFVSKIAPNPDEFLNVWHFEVVDEPTLSLSIQPLAWAEAFAASVLPTIAATLSNAIAFVEVRMQNLENPNEFGSAVLTDPVGGDVSSDVLPPFVNWTWLLRRQTRVTRNGFKRFAGVPETWVNNGQPVTGHEAAFAALAADLTTQYILEFTDPVTENIGVFPIIVHKTGQFTYVGKNTIVGAELRGLGTQVSRKYGRGS